MHPVTCLFFAVASFALCAMTYALLALWSFMSGGAIGAWQWAQFAAGILTLAAPLAFVGAAAIAHDRTPPESR